jgi:hypothetical protein
VTVGGPHRVGVSLKVGAAAFLVGLLAAQGAVPPLAVAGGLAASLVAVVFAERMLIPRAEPG